MKARTDQAHTVIIGEPGAPADVRLGMRLVGDDELATVTITQRNKTTTLAFTDSAHAARIADALLGYQPYAVVVSREEAEGERPPAPDVSRLAEALRRIADLPIDPCSTENDYRLSAAKAIAAGELAAHRKGGSTDGE